MKIKLINKKLIYIENIASGIVELKDEVKKIQDDAVSDDKISSYSEYIESIHFNTYSEFLVTFKMDNEVIGFDSNVKIGKLNLEKCEVEVDNINNVLINVNKYKSDIEETGVKTYYFNAKIDSIASVFDLYATSMLERNVRDNIITVNEKGDISNFADTLKNYPSNFFMYNNGITIITESEIDTSNNRVIIETPKIINGAHTLGKYLLYKIDAELTEDIEVPLRIMIIADNAKEKEMIASDISIKINTQKPVVADNLLYNLVEKKGLMRAQQDDEGNKRDINIQKNSKSMREYLKLFVCVFLQKPGTAKSGMTKVLEKVINDETEVKSMYEYIERVENNLIFTNAETITTEMPFTFNVTDQHTVDSGKVYEELSEFELHHILSTKIRDEVSYLLSLIKKEGVNTKFDQYIIGVFYLYKTKRYSLSIDLLNEKNAEIDELYEWSKELVCKTSADLLVDDLEQKLQECPELIFNNLLKSTPGDTGVARSTVLTRILKQILNEKIKEYCDSNNIDKLTRSEKAKITKSLDIEHDKDYLKCKSILEQNFSKKYDWDLILKYKSFTEKMDDSTIKEFDEIKSLEQIKAFANYYVNNQHTYKSDYFYEYLKSKIEANESRLSYEEQLFLNYFSNIVFPAKRLHEVYIVETLFSEGGLSFTDLHNKISESYYDNIEQTEILKNAIDHLSREIFKKVREEKKYIPIVRKDSGNIEFSDEFKNALRKNLFRTRLFQELKKIKLEYKKNNYIRDELVTIGKEYTRKQAYKHVLRDYDSAVQVQGYSTFKNEVLIFITLGDTKPFTSYDNEILDNKNLTWYSKKHRRLSTAQGDLTIEGKIAENLMKLRVFLRKNTAENFLYLGEVHDVIDSEQVKAEDGETLIKYTLELENPIDSDIISKLT